MTTYQRLVIVIRLYYFLLLFTLYEILLSFFISPLSPLIPLIPLEIIAWTSPENFLLFKKSISVIGPSALVMCIVYPWNRPLRFTSLITILLAVAIQSSYGKLLRMFILCFSIDCTARNKSLR